MEETCFKSCIFLGNNLLAPVAEYSSRAPQRRDTIWMSLPGIDVLGKLNPVCQGPIFTQMVLDKLDLERLLKGLDNPEDKKLKILIGV